MDLNKLLKRKEKAKQEKSQQSLAEACSKLGNFYNMQGKHDKALEEYKETAEICKSLSMRMDEGRAYRMIGEVLAVKAQYDDSLKYENLFLKIAKEQKDLVEMQRAYATLGRSYLLKAEDENDNGEKGDISKNEDFKSAERAFLKGLLICKDLGSVHVSKHELADMQARILLNLGLMNEHKSTTVPSKGEDAIKNYEKAIKICKSNDVFELHHSSLMALGYFYALKRNDCVSAMQTYNNALEVAKRIGESRNEKMCETLLAKGNLLIENGDFQSAKQALKKAFKIKTSVVSDMEGIQKKFRIVSALCKYEDELVTTDSLDYVKRKELFEKLGDATCKVKNYKKAIDFYKKSLEAAELNDGDMGKRLIPIYVSLYQTYIDMKDYENALKFLHMEYDLIKEIPKEACTTLLSIANLLHIAKKDFWEIDAAYRKALAEARLTDDISMERIVMKKLASICREFNMSSLAEMLVLEAAEKHIDLNVNDDDDEGESEEIEFSEEIDINDVIVDDFELSTDADSSDGNDTIHIQNVSSSGRRKKSLAIKKNAKGETRLHEACINGNYQLVKMLIEQGHAINVRDNAGWLPLHEASNHGHRDVVELLLDNGAQSMINDKGGTNCDGISPLYDSASNGHLRVIQLLLDRGAKATIKTDGNETPLDGLIRWYESTSDLSSSEKDFYEELKARLKEQCEKVGIDTKNRTHLSSLASSGYGSNNTNARSSQQQQRHSLRFATNFSDESDNENNHEKKESRKKNAGEDYKNVIGRLRNPYREAEHEADNHNEHKRRSAYLNAKEIDPDDWLENDLGHAKKKQKFFKEKSLNTFSNIDSLPQSSPSPSPSSSSSSIDKFNLLSEKTLNDLLDSDERENKIIVGGKVSDYHDTITNTLDAFDMLMFNAEGSNPTKRKSRRNSQTKVSQNKNSVNQSSLFDAGFSRFIDFTDETSSCSSTKKSPINSHNSSLNESLNRNSAASSSVEKQMTIIKVQIEDEKIIVPINREVANELKISWLIEESAKRYYRLKGIRPELKLKTADGATLLESDSLDIVLCLRDENLIFSEILDWKLPTLSNRYLEACSELKCGVDRDINDFLDLNRASISVDLSNRNLHPSTSRPILKSLQHQNCLSQLNMSSNFLQDEGLKYLSQTLITLRQLTILDLSGNAITEGGLEHLFGTLIKSSLPTELKCLKLNFNPIKSISLNHLSELCRCKSITSLSLIACELVNVDAMETLNTIKELEISYNHLSQNGFKTILRKLNPTIIERINLERCTEQTNVGENIVEFITSGCYTSLKELNLSGLKLNENEILDILRSLERCENLRYLDLSFQKELTFLSFKYLLLHMNNRNLNINLMGCRNLQKISNMFNVCRSHIDFFSCHPCQVQLSMPKRTAVVNQRNDFIAKMRDVWNEITDTRGMIHVERNSLKLFVENHQE